MFHVYILQSQQTGRYYIGSTNDTTRRLRQHNAGYVTSTKRFLPWEMVYTEDFKEHIIAARREREIKSKKSRQFLERLIQAKNGSAAEKRSSASGKLKVRVAASPAKPRPKPRQRKQSSRK